jgi:CRP-like cAMP-binding protein
MIKNCSSFVSAEEIADSRPRFSLHGMALIAGCAQPQMTRSDPLPPRESILLSLPRELSEPLFSRARPVFIKAGRVLFLAGEEGNGCYLLQEGLLKVTVGLSPQNKRVIAVLVPGSVPVNCR